MKASVIIPTHNRARELRITLGCIVDQKYADDWEIVVVNNASTDETGMVVKELAGQNLDVRHVSEPRLGLHYARNTGALQSKHEILVYLDDDMTVSPGWLEAMLAPYREESVGCVGGKIAPDFEVDPPGWIKLFHPGFLGILDLGEGYREVKWPQDVYGGNMSLRRSVYLDVNGFHPDAFGDKRMIWFRGDGETGLVKKIYEAGYKVVYAGEALAYHRIRDTNLTKEFFYNRAYKQGLSDNFSYYRQIKPSVWGLIRRWAWFKLRALRFRLTSHIADDPNGYSIKYDCTAGYMNAIAAHSFRLMISKDLQEFVQRRSYAGENGLSHDEK